MYRTKNNVLPAGDRVHGGCGRLPLLKEALVVPPFLVMSEQVQSNMKDICRLQNALMSMNNTPRPNLCWETNSSNNLPALLARLVSILCHQRNPHLLPLTVEGLQ